MAKKRPLTRKIYLVGAIDEELYLAFSKRLSALERADADLPVEVEINSPGGSPYDALAFSGRIRASSCPIFIRAYGLVASAAVIILASGTWREMSKDAWLMVHEDSATLEGETRELEREANHLRRMEHQWGRLLAELTGSSKELWDKLHRKTTYMSAAECLDVGIIDEVL